MVSRTCELLGALLRSFRRQASAFVLYRNSIYLWGRYCRRDHYFWGSLLSGITNNRKMLSLLNGFGVSLLSKLNVSRNLLSDIETRNIRSHSTNRFYYLRSNSAKKTLWTNQYNCSGWNTTVILIRSVVPR